MSKTFRQMKNNTAESWWKDPGLRRNVLSAFCNGYDGSYLNGLQSLATWNNYFDSPSGNRLGLISAVAYIPSLAVMPLYSLSCDYLGRRLTAFLGCLFLFAGAFIGTFAHNEGMLIAGRALVGIASSSVTLATNLYCNEIYHPRLRSIGSAFFLVFYYIGAIVASWASFGVVASGMDERGNDWAWRIPTLLQIVGPLFVCAGIMFVPESPRWLVARGKKEKAHQVLADQHANGKMDDELVLHELEEIENAIINEKREKQGFSAFLRTRGNRHRLLILATTATGSQGNGVAVFSYYLTPVLRLVGVDDAQTQLGLNAGMQIWNLLLAGVGASLVERAGRRGVWLMGTGGMLCCYIILIGLSGSFANTQHQATGLASIAFMSPLAYSYSTEILPFSMRASGMALFIWMQNATLCVNQFVNPIALDKYAWKWYFIFLVALVIFLVVIYFTFVETKGLSLEEIALLFDHNEAPGLDGKKEAVDAHFKAGGRTTEIRHLEDAPIKGDADSSV
ncbi:hypothetical protein JCM8097_003718 [Rhodosporidiobolus ruineniae]